MRKFIHHMKSASNHGKGLRQEEIGDYEGALHYFKQSLVFAEKCDDETLIPFELEAAARIYFKMGSMDNAENMAKRSLTKYEEIKHYGNAIQDSIKRVRLLLESILPE